MEHRFLVELLQAALDLPASVWKARDLSQRKSEMDLISEVISQEQIDLWKARGITVRRAISVQRELATLRFDVTNGVIFVLTATYSKRGKDASSISVKVDGKEYGRPVTTTSDFAEILEGLVNKSLVPAI